MPSCFASIPSGLDLALKAEHKYTFFGAVLSPASILMLTQINVKFKSVHGALAACLLLMLSWYGLYDHANLIFTGFACVLNRKHSDYLTSIFS